jgi:hypothetical protein
MKTFVYLFMLASLVCGNTAACLAQQPGPATLENLVNSPEDQDASAVTEVDAGPKPPAGTVARPKDGVQHPDLDKAWADYDAVVAKAAEGIKAAITKQFDAAAEKGDLDAAEKWQTALEKFKKTGEVPSGSETKSAVSAAVADYKKAKEELGKAYESVVKALTMEKKIAEAKAAREERRFLEEESQPDSTHGSNSRGQETASTKTTARGRPQSAKDRILAVAVGAWRHPNGNLEEIRQDGSYVINLDPRHGYSGRWSLDMGDPKGPCVVRQANNGTTERWYVNPAVPDQVVSQTGQKMQRDVLTKR